MSLNIKLMGIKKSKTEKNGIKINKMTKKPINNEHMFNVNRKN
jgi:hypothetical protein